MWDSLQIVDILRFENTRFHLHCSSVGCNYIQLHEIEIYIENLYNIVCLKILLNLQYVALNKR